MASMRDAPWKLALLLLALALASCTASPEPGRVEINVYAATSLRDVLQELAEPCERRLGVRPVFNFAGSNVLARQIEAGGKADVFLSADEEWMDRLARAGRIDGPSRVALLSNRLVVVVPADRAGRIRNAEDLAAPSTGRLAVADPDAVPAGKYAKAWLERTGRWEELRDRIVPALDVRAALALVETDAADAGIVYRTDARSSRKVQVAFEVPEGEAPAISYPLAAVAGSPHVEAARRFVSWLSSDEVVRAFERFGFVVKGRGARP